MIPSSSIGGARVFFDSAVDRFQLPSTAFTVTAALLMLGSASLWALRVGASRDGAGPSGGAPGPPAATAHEVRCVGQRDTVWLDSLPWPIDSAQAVRRATAVLQGGTALALPLRVATYEATPRRVRVTVMADLEPRVVLQCGSGRVAIYPGGSAVVEERLTAVRGATRDAR